MFKAKTSLKIRTVNKAGLFWYWSQFSLDLDHIFFRNKTFLFFKIESLNFQHLFKKEFHETSPNFNLFSSFRQFLFSFFYQLSDWVEIIFQTDAESFSFLSWKKKVLCMELLCIAKKNWPSISNQKSFVYWPNFQWRVWPGNS